MRQLRKSRTEIALAALALFSISTGLLPAAPALFAQTAVTGGLNGVVVDSTGAVVPGA